MTPEQIVSAAAEMLGQHNPFRDFGQKLKESAARTAKMHPGGQIIDLRKRPDGVWELPK